MPKQKLSKKAAAAKKKRDLAFAKTFARKRKKAKKNRGNYGKGTKKEK